jgi:hypothetical protein
LPPLRNALGFHARVDASWSPRVLVYAITDLEAVKVGKCTGHPRARLATLQCGSSRQLFLLAYTSTLTERAAHRKLHRWKVRGEWHQVAPVLREIIGWDWLAVALYAQLRGQLCTS